MYPHCCRWAAIVVGAFLCFSVHPVRAGTFTSFAVGLDGQPITDATVQVLSEQGLALNQNPSSFDTRTQKYSVSVDNAILQQFGLTNVSLRFTAPGRET